MEELKDRITLFEGILKITQKQKKEIKKHNEEIASLMDHLITDETKQELASFTQENFKNLLELEIQIAKLEEGLKYLKGLWYESGCWKV